GVVEPRTAPYEGAIRTLIKVRKGDQAFEIAEQAHARWLLELMADHAGTSRAQSPRDQVIRTIREIFAERSNADGQRAAELDRAIGRLTDSVTALDSVARASDPAAATRFPSAVPLAELTGALLGPDRALLSFFWGERSVYGWWITPTQTRVVQLGPA